MDMRTSIAIATLSAAAVALAGCSSKEYVIPAGSPERDQAQVAADAEQGSRDRVIGSCKKLVLDQMKSPSTAQWIEIEAEKVQPFEDYSYRVKGAVDSENSFGALLRTNFGCSSTKVDGKIPTITLDYVDER